MRGTAKEWFPFKLDNEPNLRQLCFRPVTLMQNKGRANPESRYHTVEIVYDKRQQYFLAISYMASEKVKT